ncbi:MAG: hypothetical protein JNM63_00805 [Spirochaetia bacterium]|nr:hypothetical protein [Spirochaetia bacterium]
MKFFPRRFFRFTFSSLVWIGVAFADFLSPPPDLIEKDIPEIKMKFVMPKDWHFKKTGGRYTFTEKNPGLFGCYDTGLEAKIDLHSKEKDPEGFIKKKLEELFSKGEVVKAIERQENKPVVSFSGILKTKKDTRAYTLMANKTTKTIYLLSFRAPSSNWSGLWERGKFMIGSFSMDDEI